MATYIEKVIHLEKQDMRNTKSMYSFVLNFIKVEHAVTMKDKIRSRYENRELFMSLKYNTHKRSHNIMNVKCHMNLKRDV